jgi:transposase InsO family protein
LQASESVVAQAKVVIREWKQEYTNHRRHSALGYRTPTGDAAARTHR